MTAIALLAAYEASLRLDDATYDPAASRRLLAAYEAAVVAEARALAA